MFVTTLIAIAPLFALIGIGVLTRRMRLLDPSDSGVLSRFAIQIALPGLILSALLTKRFVAADAELPTLYWIAQFAGLGCVLAAQRLLRLDRPTTGAAMLATFGNTGFLGYPITTALHPSELPAAVFIDQFGMSLLLYPGAIILAALYGEGLPADMRPWREIAVLARSPLFLALGAGLLLRAVFVLAPSLPSLRAVGLSEQALALIGSATIPVVLVSIGMRLSGRDAGRYAGIIAVIGAIKLVVMPAVCFAVGRYVYHIGGGMLAISVQEAAVPPSAAATIFAGQFRMNSSLAVASFFVLTLASAITLPVVLSIFR